MDYYYTLILNKHCKKEKIKKIIIGYRESITPKIKKNIIKINL